MAVLYETERLLVRDLTDDDLPALYELHRHDEVMRWLKSPPSAGVEEERARLEGWRARFPSGLGFLALVERDTTRLVGLLVLKPFDHLPYLDLGWRLHPEVWGRGYATEAARGAMTYARDVLGRTDVAAVTLPDNARSRAVMERLGMTYAGDVVHADLPHVLYLPSSE
jgi:RimJ/RimL family protein N-acetyltransferase